MTDITGPEVSIDHMEVRLMLVFPDHMDRVYRRSGCGASPPEREIKLTQDSPAWISSWSRQLTFRRGPRPFLWDGRMSPLCPMNLALEYCFSSKQTLLISTTAILEVEGPVHQQTIQSAMIPWPATAKAKPHRTHRWAGDVREKRNRRICSALYSGQCFNRHPSNPPP